MKKHIFGFAIFSFIIGATVLVSGLLATMFCSGSPVLLKTNYAESERKTYCNMKRSQRYGTEKIKIEQAFLDQNNRELKTFIALKNSGKDSDPYTVALHFFTKNGDQTRFVATENVYFETGLKNNETTLKSLSWTDKLETTDNLYVQPEATWGLTKYKGIPPGFDQTNAAPVLLSRGKTAGSDVLKCPLK